MFRGKALLRNLLLPRMQQWVFWKCFKILKQLNPEPWPNDASQPASTCFKGNNGHGHQNDVNDFALVSFLLNLSRFHKFLYAVYTIRCVQSTFCVQGVPYTWIQILNFWFPKFPTGTNWDLSSEKLGRRKYIYCFQRDSSIVLVSAPFNWFPWNKITSWKKW